MRTITFKTLDECIECYGRENLIAIDTLPQIIFYIVKGVQPKYIAENQIKPGRLTCWFHKGETKGLYKEWQNSHPKKDK